jgi:hypothetical protein
MKPVLQAHIALPGKRFPVESLHEEHTAVSTKAEAGLYSEIVVIEEQALQAQPLKEGENLLSVASGAPLMPRTARVQSEK